MNRKQKRKQKKSATPPVFVFTPASLKITQEAMKLFEQSLQRSKSLPEKIAFAQQTTRSVNDKLDKMSKSVGLLCLTTFDYNEKIVIGTAIQQYVVAFLPPPLTAEQQRELSICRQIERFAQVHKIEPSATTRD